MRVAVAGATGNIGSVTVVALQMAGHDVVPISRRLGIDLLTADGLDHALHDVEAVIDVTNGPATNPRGAADYFRTLTQNLLAAEKRAGVRHHVLLSIAGLYGVQGNAHYVGKREQESVVSDGAVPWTIVPATQFHDFPAMVASWAERDGVARIPPLLLQPVAPRDVAGVLVDIAVGGEAHGRYVDLAGPDTEDFVDMARRTNDARGRSMKLVPTWSGMFGLEMAGNALLPGADARLMPTSFDAWLEDQY